LLAGNVALETGVSARPAGGDARRSIEEDSALSVCHYNLVDLSEIAEHDP
jgi:hypothetical protein